MSFLFDGVPDPNNKEIINSNDSLSQLDSANIIEAPRKNLISKKSILHPPYKERECANCHDKSVISMLLHPQPGLCYGCHEDFDKMYNFVHGPVAGGYCTSCHNPHMAKLEKLLLRSGQQLCLYCHNSTRVFKNNIHKDIGDINCSECHNPHGGEDRYLLN
ncbi:MAG: cytochrome c3 family protein [Bacteroidota bacterium]